MKGNYNNPQDVIKYAVDGGFDCLKVNEAHLLGRFKRHKEYFISDEEYDNLIERFRKLTTFYPIELELPWEKYLNKSRELPCSAGKKTVYVAPNGDIFPCSFIPRYYLWGNYKVGNF